MSEWYAPLCSAHALVAVEPDRMDAMPDGRFRAHECQLDYVPIALTEIFIVGQSLPLTALQTEHGLLLVAELRAGGQSVAAFDDAGNWRLPYRPMALRLLPFLARADGSLWRMECHGTAHKDPQMQPDLPVRRALTDFSRAVNTASKLLAMAVEAGLVRMENDGGDGTELRHNPSQTSLIAAHAACCRLVEAIRFSQQAKPPRAGDKRHGLFTARAGATGVRVEQVLSFDEAIRFRFEGRGQG